MKLEMNALPFKPAIEIISELVSEIYILFKEDCLEIATLDPDFATHTTFRLYKLAFISYQIEHEESIPVNLKLLKQILKKVKNETISLETTEDKKLKVEVLAGNKQTFILPPAEPPESKQLPDLSFKIDAVLPSKDLQNAIDLAKMFSKDVTFAIENSKLIIKSTTEEGENKIELSSAQITNNNALELIYSTYSTELLSKMVKASKLCSEVKISFDNQYPLKLEFNKSPLFLSFLLAPRVRST